MLLGLKMIVIVAKRCGESMSEAFRRWWPCRLRTVPSDRPASVEASLEQGEREPCRGRRSLPRLMNVMMWRATASAALWWTACGAPATTVMVPSLVESARLRDHRVPATRSRDPRRMRTGRVARGRRSSNW